MRLTLYKKPLHTWHLNNTPPAIRGQVANVTRIFCGLSVVCTSPAINLFTTIDKHIDIGGNGAVVNVSTSPAKGPGFESRWLHSSFSLKSLDCSPLGLSLV